MDTCPTFQTHAELVAAARQHLPDTEDLLEVADFFAALGNPTRLKILYTLDGRELCTCDLAAVAGLSVSAVSHQLRLLRDRRLIASRKQGKNVFHRLRDDHVADVLAVAREHQREEPRRG